VSWSWLHASIYINESHVVARLVGTALVQGTVFGHLVLVHHLAGGQRGERAEPCLLLFRRPAKGYGVAVVVTAQGPPVAVTWLSSLRARQVGTEMVRWGRRTIDVPAGVLDYSYLAVREPSR
jgi:hypothetical protein